MSEDEHREREGAGPRERSYPADADARAERRAIERELFRRYQQTKDPAIRTELVERFLPLARRLARRYERAGEPLDDLVQTASVGLLGAIERYDPEHGAAFTSFAVPTIVGELRRHFRDRGWSVRVPRELQETALAVEKSAAALLARNGRSPSPAEIAEHSGIGIEQVLEGMEAGQAQHAVSFERPLAGEGGDVVTVGDTLGTEEEGYAVAEAGATIERLAGSLDERSRLVLHLRFAEDLTQSEIGTRIGVSQMHVSRILRRALQTLREEAYARSSGGTGKPQALRPESPPEE